MFRLLAMHVPFYYPVHQREINTRLIPTHTHTHTHTHYSIQCTHVYNFDIRVYTVTGFYPQAVTLLLYANGNYLSHPVHEDYNNSC